MRLRRERLSLLTFCLLVAWGWGLADSLRALIAGQVSPLAWPPLVLGALGLALLRPSHTGGSSEPRRHWLLRLGMLGPALVASLLVGSSMVRLTSDGARQRSENLGAVLVVVLAVAATFAVGGALLALVRAGARRGRASGEAPARWTRPAAWGAAVVAAALLASGVRQASERPASHIGRLPTAAQLEPVTLKEEQINNIQGDRGAQAIARRCTQASCSYKLESSSGWVPLGSLPNGPVRAAHDPERDTWIFEAGTGQILTYKGEHPRLWASRDYRLSTMARGLAAPGYWLASGGLMLGAALSLMLRAGRWVRLRRALRGARQGVVHRGLVQMADGGADLSLPRHMASLRDGARVLVLDADATESFREQGHAREVVRGTLRGNKRKVNRRIAWHHGAALAALSMGLGPLLAARLLGM